MPSHLLWKASAVSPSLFALYIILKLKLLLNQFEITFFSSIDNIVESLKNKSSLFDDNILGVYSLLFNSFFSFNWLFINFNSEFNFLYIFSKLFILFSNFIIFSFNSLFSFSIFLKESNNLCTILFVSGSFSINLNFGFVHP